MTRIFLFLRALPSDPVVPWNSATSLRAWLSEHMRHSPWDTPDQHHTQQRIIRPFAVSPLQFPDRFLSCPDGIHPTTPWATWEIRTGFDAWVDWFVRAPMTPILVGQTLYTIDSWVTDPIDPPSNPWTTQLQSPIVVTDWTKTGPGGRGSRFVNPQDPVFRSLLIQNLAKKARSLGSPVDLAPQCTLTLPTHWHRHFWRLYHKHPVIGWMTSDPLTIGGPNAIIEAAAIFGLGISNAHGFGMLTLPLPSEVAYG